MPNWVFNQMQITSESVELLDRLVADAAEGENCLSFQKILPRPAEADADWYSWNIANWGTKWEPSEPTATRSAPTEVVYEFATAWSPPIPVVVELLRRYPGVHIRFEFEEEQGFGSVLESSENGLSVTREWDIPTAHADFLSRDRDCWCGDGDEQYYADCFLSRAEQDHPGETRMLEAVRTLAAGWEGTYQDLVAAARQL